MVSAFFFGCVTDTRAMIKIKNMIKILSLLLCLGFVFNATDAFASGPKDFDNILSLAIKEAETLITATKGERGSVISERERYQKLMSRSFAFLRNIKDMESSLEEIKTSLDTFTATNKWKSEFEIPEIFKNHDVIHMQYLIASAMIYTAKRYGSRGSALVTKNGDFLHGEKIEENESGRGFIVTASGLIPEISERAVNPIPERDLWFESVWNKSKEL